MLAVVVLAVLLGFFDLLTLVKDLTLAFPLLMPVAVAPVVGVVPLVALAPLMGLFPAAEVPSACFHLPLDGRMMRPELSEFRMLPEKGRAVR